MRSQLSQCLGLTSQHSELLKQKLNSPEYLECLKAGAFRLNLDGSVGEGIVSPADEKAAQEKLASILKLSATRQKSKTTYKITNAIKIANFNSVGLKVVNVVIDVDDQRMNITVSPKRLRAVQQILKKTANKNKDAVCYIRTADIKRVGINVPIFCLP